VPTTSSLSLWSTSNDTPTNITGKKRSITESSSSADVFSHSGAGDENSHITPKVKRGKKNTLKAALERAKEGGTDVSAWDVVKSTPSQNLIRKRNAHEAGDHSPSISALNKSLSSPFKISGRRYKPKEGEDTKPQAAVPTLQFNYLQKDDQRIPIKQKDAMEIELSEDEIKNKIKKEGEETHSVLTTLREVGDAGEQDKHECEDLLDKTLFSYTSRRDDPVKIFSTQVNKKELRVNVFSPDEKMKLINKAEGVGPFVAQATINLWYRPHPHWFFSSSKVFSQSPRSR
jgi:hypothetical protein